MMYIVGDHEEKTIEQLQDVAKRAARVAIMADGHLGYWMPIGGVAAFRDWVSPAGVGYDISLSGMVENLEIIILYKLKPSSLPYIQLLLIDVNSKSCTGLFLSCSFSYLDA